MTSGFDEEVDVVVVGYGFAGAAAAIEAAQSGAKVLLVEKASIPGGISICSYGAVRCAADVDQAFQYLDRTNGGRTPSDINRRLAEGMAEQEDYLRALAKTNGADIATTKEAGKTAANYPFPGVNAFYTTTVRSVPGFAPREVYPWANGAPGGPLLFKVLDDNLAQSGVEIRMSTPAHRLIAAPDRREVLGIEVGDAAAPTRIRARRGVVLACGGFEGDKGLQAQISEGMPVLNAAAERNTGDGIRMAQDLGAQLWHMWHFHGAYGFRSHDPSYPYAIRVKRLPDWVPGQGGFIARRDEGSAIDANQVKMAWILLDRYGKRFMNEYQPYTQDTGHRQMHMYQPEIQDYPRIPAILITDDEGRALYPLGRPTSNDEGRWHDWSQDNKAEIDAGILTQADTIEELAEKMGIDPAAARASVDRWNEICDADADPDHGRPPGSMQPIRKPPFIGAPVWPVVTNTQGGPLRNVEQEVMDVFGSAIGRLYTAGELGSCFGHLYISGGNISECLVTGRIAGRNVAALPEA